MSLFGTIQMASNALQATDVGLQVVGQNIANANTPGYSQEVLNLTPGPTQQQGGVLEGTGVEIVGVTEQIDQYVEQRLYGANSDVTSSTTQATTYQQLESLMSELTSSGTDLTTSLTNFSSSIQNVLDAPQSVSNRQLAVSSGQTLANNINSMANEAMQMQSDLNSQITGEAASINQLTNQISQLNLQIENFQGGVNNSSTAVGLVDQRQQALTSLSKIVNVNVQQQSNGSVNVYVGNDYLVYGATNQQVSAKNSDTPGQYGPSLVITNSGSPLDASSGQYVGLLNSRDQILGGFLQQLDSFSGSLASEFNKIYASGQGLDGYQSVTSVNRVSNATAPLEDAGLTNTPVNGSFQIQVENTATNQTSTYTINVDLEGLGADSTLNSVAEQINQISGISATVTANGQLSIDNTAANQSFSFANDSSGLLASLGINTFFTGDSAGTLSVNSDVANDPSLFAASTGGVAQDADNAQALSAFNTTAFADQGGATIADLANTIVSNVTEGSATATANSTSANSYQAGLQSQSASVSGVNIDEQTVNLLTLQNTYQATAQVISTINQLMSTLTQMLQVG
jgi:flagellar hook-associated protein 1 FlgK